MAAPSVVPDLFYHRGYICAPINTRHRDHEHEQDDSSTYGMGRGECSPLVGLAVVVLMWALSAIASPASGFSNEGLGVQVTQRLTPARCEQGGEAACPWCHKPDSGAGRAFEDWSAVQLALEAHGIECDTRQTARAGQARELLTDLKGFDMLVVAGGDGFLFEVLNALPRPTALPFAVVPSGTGNGVAASVGIRSPVDAAAAPSNSSPLDLLRVECTSGSEVRSR